MNGLLHTNTRINRITKFIKKNYIYVNITFILISIYIILFPIIQIPIKAIFPRFNECTYLRTTGKPCPLCGGTRYIQNLPKVFDDITYLFNPFGVIMICIFLEIIYRIYNLTTRKKEKTEKYIKIDITIHLVELITLTLYEIIVLLSN